MEPDTNQVEMSPLRNRAARRAEGWTETRLRKIASRRGLISRVPVEQPKGSLSCLSSLDMELHMEKLKKQRMPRIEGKPRRWQVERERRRGKR